MRLPIFAYGHPVLRRETREIKKDEEGLEKLINDMYDTMYAASGVGLAAPQIGRSIRLFIVDGTPMDGILGEDTPSSDGWKKVFINPEILEESGEEWGFEERLQTVRIRYVDREFRQQEEVYSGIQARIIQHEYDHLEGILFTDKVSGVKKQLIKSRLLKISKGKIDPPYPMRYYKKL